MRAGRAVELPGSWCCPWELQLQTLQRTTPLLAAGVTLPYEACAGHQTGLSRRLPGVQTWGGSQHLIVSCLLGLVRPAGTPRVALIVVVLAVAGVAWLSLAGNAGVGQCCHSLLGSKFAGLVVVQLVPEHRTLHLLPCPAARHHRTMLRQALGPFLDANTAGATGRPRQQGVAWEHPHGGVGIFRLVAPGGPPVRHAAAR